MIFARSDDVDSYGNQRVNYFLADSPGFDFTVSITKTGIQISGTTPNYTDPIEINRVMNWSVIQRQALKERGAPITQQQIDHGGIW